MDSGLHTFYSIQSGIRRTKNKEENKVMTQILLKKLVLSKIDDVPMDCYNRDR